MDSRKYLDLLVFGQPVYDGDDKVFGQSEVGGADALGAVHDEGQVQGGTFALCKHRTNVRIGLGGPGGRRGNVMSSRFNANVPQQAEQSSGGGLKKNQKDD